MSLCACVRAYVVTVTSYAGHKGLFLCFLMNMFTPDMRHACVLCISMLRMRATHLFTANIFYVFDCYACVLCISMLCMRVLRTSLPYFSHRQTPCAVLIDKDKKPAWKHRSVDDVPRDLVQRFFSTLREDDADLKVGD